MDQNYNQNLYYQDQPGPYAPTDTYSGPTQQQVALYMAKVMGWMCVGLFTTLVMSVLTLDTPALFRFVYFSRYPYAIFIVQLGLVIAFSAGINRMNSAVATVLYLLYSAFTGLTFSVLALMYEISSIIYVFGLTAGVFLLMAVFGYVTKKDMSNIGALALFALIGIIISSFVNLFIMRSSMVDLAICCIGILVFIILTAYDTQKIKTGYIQAASAGYDESSDAMQKMAIFGAFMLYLDFINIFLKLLRLLGKRR